MANTATRKQAAAVAARPSLTEAAVADFSRLLGEDDAGARWRHEAATVFSAASYPDRVRHLWRYTDPDRLLPGRELLTLAAPSTLPAVSAKPTVVLQAGVAPQANAAANNMGIEIRQLLTGAADADLLGSAVPTDHGYFEALNAAAFDAGVLIRVPRGLAVAESLRLVIPAPESGNLLPRVLVVVEEGATVTVVEDHIGGGEGTSVVGVTEVLVGPNADVRHVLIQRWRDSATGHLTQRARLDRDARFVGAVAGFGGDAVKVDLGGILAGAGARSELVGVTLPDRRQHLDHHTLHRHTCGRTWSNIDFKAVVAGRARSAYTGLLRIEKDAPGSEAFQENRNLLLSEKARVDTIPELEILTDDVNCSHGATAAPVDDEQLFYLRSRGISAAEALRLVVRGFVEPTLRQVPDDLRGELEDLVEARVARLGTGV